MKTFLQPLTKEEEVYYLQVFKTADGEKKENAKQILIERNLRLVAHIAKKYQSAEVDMEDLISIGTIGLIKALHSFDNEKQSKFATYGARCIENEILMYLRSKKKCAKEVSIYEPIGTDRDGNAIHLLDILESKQLDVVEKIHLEKNLEKLKQVFPKVLNNREREILLLRYGLTGEEELTQKEIGKMYGISRSYISRIEKKALEKLKAALEN